MKKYALVFMGCLMLLAAWWFYSQPYVESHDVAPAVSSVPAVPTAIAIDPMKKKAGSQADFVDAASVYFRQGQFYLDESIRFYFEYFILQRGDLSDAQLQAQLKQDAEHRYNPKTAKYLLELFGRYLQYLHALAKDQKDYKSVSDIHRIQLYWQEKLFNEQEQWALFNDEYLKQYRDEDSLQGKYENYLQQAEKLTNAQALDALRTETFGLEAATRFKTLEARRAQWQQRLLQYYCAKQLVQNSSGIADVDKRKQIDELQRRLFQGPELTRLKALDGQNALGVEGKDC